IDDIGRTLVCEEICETHLEIHGRNFLNSNDSLGVWLGDHWGAVVEQSSTYLRVVASQGAYKVHPIVAVDIELTRPSLRTSDEVISAMFEESVDVALASIRTAEDGQRYIVAGPKYGDPERTYYRDSYWTSGLIMMIEPYVIRDQILLLARGVDDLGRAPSALTVDPEAYQLPLWEDHLDAGLYYIMMVHDYIRWTGDESILIEEVNGRTVYETGVDILNYLATLDSDGDMLPEKPEGSLQDWLDSIPRSGEVISNMALYYRSLNNMSDMATLLQQVEVADQYASDAYWVKRSINRQFWNGIGGYYLESCHNGACEDRITNESALTILYDVAPPDQRAQLFESLKQLETRENAAVSGDWGVMNAWPYYEGFTEHDYHNATDWPFLDGMNVAARLKYNDPDWYYPMTRWWTYNQELGNGQVLPEYVSPYENNAGDLQAWSVNPMTSFIQYGLGVNPDLHGEVIIKPSPITDVLLENVVVRGERQSYTVIAQ
ncbi:MAG: amylo-alpha-1,6-glucosidase, partial [bacterium]|nr:amylo-alpha-1,6-glucosidase [bacterium]